MLSYIDVLELKQKDTFSDGGLQPLMREREREREKERERERERDTTSEKLQNCQSLGREEENRKINS